MTAAATPRQVADQGFSATAITDGHGLWLSGNGLYLYTAGGALRKVSNVVGGWILGACG